ncbi:CD225/dispanin family protein [Gordonia sp. (in: high G+C Gram-positive bacteria)]|uniref:CD225/dispanin family protein n=1 Tax=unclassified Gordonia (in: high G+C Gram-positive bacteria) TaxID=2657482 RepID=UPI002625396B|nr:CD225/dispanin family protein [Gordonia sp. (in: high G+C Gram-positive bacteria)]
MVGPVQPVEPAGGWRTPGSTPATVSPRRRAPLPRTTTPGTVARPMDYTPTLQAPVAPPQPPAPTASPQTTAPASAGESHLLLPMFACLCFLPAGIWSLIDARQAQRYAAAGHDDAAVRCVQSSRTVALTGIGLGLAVAVVVLILALNG